MTGYNAIYGAYMTKEDKRLDLISAGKKWTEAFDRCDDPTSHIAKACISEICRIERLLHSEHGMTEEEIEMAIYA